MVRVKGINQIAPGFCFSFDVGCWTFDVRRSMFIGFIELLGFIGFIGFIEGGHHVSGINSGHRYAFQKRRC